MNIKLNGDDYECPEEISSIALLLQKLSLAEQPVVVEHNGNALLPREFESACLSSGDKIEIIRVVAGG